MVITVWEPMPYPARVTRRIAPRRGALVIARYRTVIVPVMPREKCTEQ